MAKFAEQFPILNEPALSSAIEEFGQISRVAEGEYLIEVGQEVNAIPLVTAGALKILREDPEGNEIFLYYIYPGQTCAVSLNCCMNNRKSEVKAIAEEDSEFVAIPSTMMNSWLQEHQSWRAFIFDTYESRFNELLRTVDSIAFSDLDKRLISYLKQKVGIHKNATIQITHQEIANDLNSTREVISRLLKQLEKNKKVILARNKIEVL